MVFLFLHLGTRTGQGKLQEDRLDAELGFFNNSSSEISLGLGGKAKQSKVKEEEES